MTIAIKIKKELDSDPATYGPLSDQQVLDLLVLKNISQNRASMTRQEIYENIDPTALAGLTSIQLAQLNLAMSDTVNPFGNAQQVFVDIFGAGSTTVTALASSRVETVSIAQQIGVGTGISLIDIANARAH